MLFMNRTTHSLSPPQHATVLRTESCAPNGKKTISIVGCKYVGTRISFIGNIQHCSITVFFFFKDQLWALCRLAASSLFCKAHSTHLHGNVKVVSYCKVCTLQENKQGVISLQIDMLLVVFAYWALQHPLVGRSCKGLCPGCEESVMISLQVCMS